VEIRQLTYFLTAAKLQNFRKAAEVCLVAQSALSYQIASLEEELGVKLFDRVKRRVILTPAGSEFAIYAGKALEELQKGRQAMVELHPDDRGTVHLGCLEALTNVFLPTIFAKFNQQFPYIRLKVTVGGGEELLHMAEEGEIDFGMVFNPAENPELLVVQELFRQPLQLIVPVDHHFARQKAPVRLEEIIKEPLVIVTERFGSRRIIERVFAQRNLPLEPLVEIGSIEGLKEFVKQGIGISLIPPAVIKPEQIGQELVTIQLEEFNEEFPYALVYRRYGNLSMAARGLISAITGASWG
jgi:DNA-binding transcriptional LysR family regulator